jgi:hypothetical protein
MSRPECVPFAGPVGGPVASSTCGALSLVNGAQPRLTTRAFLLHRGGLS